MIRFRIICSIIIAIALIIYILYLVGTLALIITIFYQEILPASRKMNEMLSEILKEARWK